jgi:hypothetical protein
MQSAQDWATKNVPGARDRRILLQGYTPLMTIERAVYNPTIVCTESLSSGVVVVKSAKDGV